MGTTTKKITEELVAPKIPGAINKDAVKTAAAGVQDAKNAVENMTYDNFKGGSLYRGLQRDYQQQGQQAMKDTLGQVAARTGGMASSYAITAANQSYNNYMKTLEDAARSMYADEYSRAQDRYGMAQQEYANAYGEYRDNVGDAWTRYNAENDAYRYKDTQTKERVATQKTDLYKLVASGGTPNKDDYPDLSDEEYNYIVATATGNRTDDNRLNVDKEFESIFGAEDFDWNKYDWNGDGKVDETDSADDYDFSGSSYGADYWQQYWRDAQQGYADADTKEAQENAVDDIEARIANGDNLDTIAKDYGIGDDGNSETVDKTWEEVTGMSKAEWQQRYNDNQTKNYTYQNTPTGRNDIISTLTNSASLSLSDKDQKNFDYIYGDGAYDEVQKFIADISPDNTGSDSFKNAENFYDTPKDVFVEQFNKLFDKLISAVPGISEIQVFELIEKANPEMYNAATNLDTYAFYDRER